MPTSSTSVIVVRPSILPLTDTNLSSMSLDSDGPSWPYRTVTLIRRGLAEYSLHAFCLHVDVDSILCKKSGELDPFRTCTIMFAINTQYMINVTCACDRRVCDSVAFK
jgi:hypothetical protein